MSNVSQPGNDRLRLYHAPSSFYSMITRLALAECGLAFEPVFVDIHFRMSRQQPDYVRLNPGMTVPTLVGPDFVLRDSRDMAEYAFGLSRSAIDANFRPRPLPKPEKLGYL